MTYRDGLVAMVEMPKDLGVGTSVVLFGRRECHGSLITFGTGKGPLFFAQLIYRIGSMVLSGQSPIPYPEECCGALRK